ncbi:MAG: zinc-finger domain-containing protein [Methyloligellaceae bacterium]|nr:MAG: zinc-finger domain-containing protein [Alphaproteobacteria bacterium]
MADAIVPHFCNDLGVSRIEIGVSEFQCMGASPPYDHPHVFLDMGDDDEIICPYCSTVYVLNTALKPDESNPPGCLHRDSEAA